MPAPKSKGKVTKDYSPKDWEEFYDKVEYMENVIF